LTRYIKHRGRYQALSSKISGNIKLDLLDLLIPKAPDYHCTGNLHVHQWNKKENAVDPRSSFQYVRFLEVKKPRTVILSENGAPPNQ